MVPFLSRIRVLLILLSVVALALATGCGGSGSASTPSGGGASPSPPDAPSTVAFLYTASGADQIAASYVTSDGVLHAVPGSPFTGPSRSLVVSSAYVFATDGHMIQTYTRNSDGSLVAASSILGTAHNLTPGDSMVSSLTLDRTGSTLYAGEINSEGADNNAFAAFTVGPSGMLTFLSNSSISVNYGGTMSFTQDNRFAYGTGCYFIGWDVWGLSRAADGSQAGFETNAFAAPPYDPEAIYCPGPIAVSAKGYVAITARDITSSAPGRIAMYRISSDGTLSLVEQSAITPALTGIRSMQFDPTGNIFAIAGLSSLLLYQLSPEGLLSPLGTMQHTSGTLAQVAWDNANHLYATTGSTLYIFNVGTGGLTQATGSPYDSKGYLVVLPTT